MYFLKMKVGKLCGRMPSGGRTGVASKWSTICSQHFREEDVDRTSLSTVRLLKNAVPSVFPTNPKHLQNIDKMKPPVQKESHTFKSSVLSTTCRVQDEELSALVPENTVGPSNLPQASSNTADLKRNFDQLVTKNEQYRKQIKTLQQFK